LYPVHARHPNVQQEHIALATLQLKRSPAAQEVKHLLPIPATDDGMAHANLPQEVLNEFGVAVVVIGDQERDATRFRVIMLAVT
jgi:hypothetical protein